MQSKNIVSVIAILCMAMFLIVSILTGDGSNIGALAKSFAIISFILGIVLKRFGIYLLVVYGATSDIIKRMLVIEGSFTHLDITYILMMSPLLMFGLFLGAFTDGLLKNNITKIQWVSLGLALFLGVANLLMGGGLRGGVFGLLQQGANVVSYFFLPFFVLRTFRSLDDYFSLVKFTIVVFVLVALHGLNQGLFGYSSFEYKYLISGFTSIVHSIPEETRPFSSCSSPAAFAYVAGVIGVATLLLSGLKVSYAGGLREKRAVYGKVMGLIFTFILIWGCLISQSRAAILASLFTIPLFFLLKSYRVMFITYLFAFVILVTLIFSSKYILEKNLLHRYQHEIAPKITEVTGIKPRYFTLATMHIRLEGWANIVNNPEFQKPFGNRKLVKETKGISRQQRKSLNLETHDMISSLLLNFGWVSLLFLCVVGGAVLRKIHQVIASLPSRSLESKCARIGLVALIAVYVTTLTGAAIGAFPVCLVANILLCLSFLAVRDFKFHQAKSQADANAHAEFEVELSKVNEYMEGDLALSKP